MDFNSPTFLFIFLPVFLLLYFFAAPQYRNLIALCASLVFFAAGQAANIPLILGLVIINYWLGIRIERAREQPAARWYLTAGISLNLALLLLYKAFAAYNVDWVPSLSRDTLIPLGLSYITFQLVAYLIDVYNEVTDSEQSFLNFALYVMLFPKIVTGPITRYRDLAAQLNDRQVTAEAAASGARRFITGLAKKALIADTLARVVDPAFALNSPSFTTSIAWLVLVAFGLQLYFDFSGYTDMAIGLGQMLGFRFAENFNYPYIARSISEFWRRWHVTLSSWFRDYVFYPLEFRRHKPSLVRQQLHILIVFLLTGLWHGLTLNFVLWGMVHGLGIALEMTVFGRWLKKASVLIQHTYTLGVLLVGWVFFRSTTFLFALKFLARLAGVQRGVRTLPFSVTAPLPIVDNSVWLALALGIFFSLPVLPALRSQFQRIAARRSVVTLACTLGLDLSLLFLLIVSIAAVSSRSLVASSIYRGF